MQRDLIAFGSFGSRLLRKKRFFAFGDAAQPICIFRQIDCEVVGAVQKIFRELLAEFGFFSADLCHFLLAGLIEFGARKHKPFDFPINDSAASGAEGFECVFSLQRFIFGVEPFILADFRKDSGDRSEKLIDDRAQLRRVFHAVEVRNGGPDKA